MDNICGQCRHFGMYRLEPTCTKKMKPAGYFDEKKCFENKITMKDNQTNQEPSRMEESCAPAEVATKICKGCHHELPIEQFGRHAKSRDGFQSYCPECRSLKAKHPQKKKAAVAKEARKGIPVVVASTDPAVIVSGQSGPVSEEFVLGCFPDEAIIAELGKRGWRGRLTREEYKIVGPINQKA